MRPLFVSLVFLFAPVALAESGDDTRLTAGVDLFAQYSTQWLAPGTDLSSWFHQVDVTRAHAFLDATRGAVRTRVLLEGVRSTADGALLGVGGDSFLVRFREASIGFDAGDLRLDAGIVPTTAIPILEGAWQLRPVAMTALEASGLAFPADLGAKARWSLPSGLGELQLGLFSGEGYARREMNRGKTSAGSLLLTPFSGMLAPLRALVFGEYGSTGVGSARAHRAGAVVFWQGSLLTGGGGLTEAFGVNDVGSRQGSLLFAFARIEPSDGWILGTQLARMQRNVTENREIRTDFTVSAGRRVASGLELHLVVHRGFGDPVAEAADPLLDQFAARVVARATL